MRGQLKIAIVGEVTVWRKMPPRQGGGRSSFFRTDYYERVEEITIMNDESDTITVPAELVDVGILASATIKVADFESRRVEVEVRLRGVPASHFAAARDEATNKVDDWLERELAPHLAQRAAAASKRVKAD